MELICPDCRAELTVVDPHSATCPGHDGRYQILFDRELGAAQPGTAAAAPGVEPAAGLAEIEEDPNIKHCATCDAPNPLTAERCGACGDRFTLLNLSARRPAPSRLNITCAQHPEVQAVTRCRICSKGVCATCDFLLPGNVHVCPSCLETGPSDEISPRRRNLMIGAFVIASYCTVMLFLLLSRTLHRMFGNSEGANMLIGNAILWPSIIGVGVAFSAVDRRLRNSMGIRAAVIWNGVNAGIFLLLMVIGMSRR